MTLTLPIEDRVAIQEVLAQYCFTLDDRDWSAFAALFHAQAVLDFTACGGPRGSAAELIGFLQAIAAQVPAWQHTTSTQVLTAHADHVAARTAAQVMMVNPSADGGNHVSFYGLWYRDTLVKEAGRWLIRERVQQYAWSHSVAG